MMPEAWDETNYDLNTAPEGDDEDDESGDDGFEEECEDE